MKRNLLSNTDSALLDNVCQSLIKVKISRKKRPSKQTKNRSLQLK